MPVLGLLEHPLEDRIDIAVDNSTSQDALAELANDSNNKVRKNVAENPNTSLDTLKKLSDDIDDAIRLAVAHHPNVSVELLLKLARDTNKEIRLYIAKNKNTPSEILDVLADDFDEEIRYSVANNSSSLPLTVEKVVCNSKLSVKSLAKIAQRTDLTESTYIKAAKELTINNPKFLEAFKNL